MTIRRWVSPVLIGAMLTAFAPVNAWAAGPESSKSTKPTAAPLNAAIARAAADAAHNPSLQLRTAPPKSGVRMQGGGHTMMVITLVSTVAGIGATYYAVKQLQKNTKTIEQPSLAR
jgi:uncharacterized protein HemX